MGEIVVAITGASGAIYGKRLLEVLNSHGRDTRMVVSKAGEITLQHECGISKETLAFTMIIILNLGLRPKRQNSNDDPNC